MFTLYAKYMHVLTGIQPLSSVKKETVHVHMFCLTLGKVLVLSSEALVPREHDSG